MLEYKQEWLGGRVEYVPAAYTSQRCNACGYTDKENRLSQSKFKCMQCGHEANADHNAALNILAAGHAVLVGEQRRTIACGPAPERHYFVPSSLCGSTDVTQKHGKQRTPPFVQGNQIRLCLCGKKHSRPRPLLRGMYIASR